MMAITFRCTLRCAGCGARITYTDEPPPRRCDLPDPDLITEAEAWLAAHGDERRPWFGGPSLPAYVDAIVGGHYHLMIPEGSPYAECPACGGCAEADAGDDAPPLDSAGIA